MYVVVYRRMFAYAKQTALQLNDTILLKREVDDQWIYAFNTRTGQHGIVPIAFLDVKVPLTPTPSLSTTPTIDSRRNVGIKYDLIYILFNRLNNPNRCLIILLVMDHDAAHSTITIPFPSVICNSKPAR